MARISYCEIKDSGCDDPNCKIGRCILMVEAERAERLEREAFEARVDDEMPAKAEALLKARGIRNTSWPQIRDLMQNPKVRDLVRKHLRDFDNLPPIIL